MRHLRQHDDQDYWKQCKPGTILSVSDSGFERERRQFLIRTAMGGAVVATGIFSGVFATLHGRQNAQVADNALAADDKQQNSSFSEPKRPVSITLSCSDIQEQLERYVVAFYLDADDRSPQQAQFVEDFGKHLTICPKCVKVVSARLLRDV